MNGARILLEFALGNAAGEDQRFSAAADGAIEGFHAHFAGAGRSQDFLPNFGLPGPQYQREEAVSALALAAIFFDLGLEFRRLDVL